MSYLITSGGAILATLDSIEGIVSSNNFFLQQVNGFPPGSPETIRKITSDTRSFVNDITGGALGLGTLNAKLDALSTLLHHVSDGIDTLLNTLNGGHIDTNLDLVITKVSAMESDTAKIGEIQDDWNLGDHTLFGSVNTGFGNLNT